MGRGWSVDDDPGFSPGDVQMSRLSASMKRRRRTKPGRFSGCMDSQTSADCVAGGVAGGAMTNAFLAVLSAHDDGDLQCVRARICFVGRGDAANATWIFRTSQVPRPHGRAPHRAQAQAHVAEAPALAGSRAGSSSGAAARPRGRDADRAGPRRRRGTDRPWVAATPRGGPIVWARGAADARRSPSRSSQKFELADRAFSLSDGVLGNGNAHLGRPPRQPGFKKRPNTAGAAPMGGLPMEEFLAVMNGGDGGDALVGKLLQLGISLASNSF